MIDLFAQNLLVYSAQVFFLVICAALASLLMKSPRLRLLHWQWILAACLLLPVAQRWRPDDAGDVTITTGPVRVLAPAPAPASKPIPWTGILLGILVAGSAVFGGRLILGAIRIHLYRRNSKQIPALSPEAEFHISHEVTVPITFGILRPVVLLPTSFIELKPDLQHAIAAHELAHIRRKDWIFALAEEATRAVLWFHPAIWYVLSKIQVARELVVDEDVVRATGNRESYIDALLAFARLRTKFQFVPAPLFLRKRHLAERVAHILQEVNLMSKRKMLLSMAMSMAVTVIAGAIVVSLLPLRAPAQEQTTGALTRSSGLPKIIHQVRPQYPPDAKLKRIQGTVLAEVSIDERGLVTDTRIISGPNELRRAAQQAILQWQFAPSGRASRGDIELNFALNEEQKIIGTLKGIDLAGIPEHIKQRVAGLIPVKEGDVLAQDTIAETRRALAEVDSRLTPTLTADNVLVIQFAAPAQIRVGGNVQSAKLVKKVTPLYPALAKQARVQGQVRMNVVIDKAGKVSNIDLVSGDPELATAAMDAVRQWEYQTTLLNGNPVAVMTTVDVNFTLAQ